MRTVRKCISDGTPWMDHDGCAFRVDSSFEGSSAEGHLQFREGGQSQALGRWRQERVRINPEVLRENAKRRVVGLEAAVAAMIANGIDEQSPEVATLKECLLKAKRSAEEPPVSAQLKGAQEFVERAQKRLVAHDAQRKALENELAEGEARVQRLQVLVEAPPQVPPPPAEWGAQVTSLQQTVNQFQAERDALAEQVKHQTTLKLVERVHPMQSSVDAEQLVLDRASKRRAVGEEIPKWPARSRRLDVFKTIGVEGRAGDGRGGDCQGVGAIDGQRRSQDGIFPVHGFKHGEMTDFVCVLRPRWGWRGVRVGEASNPGPLQTRQARRLERSNPIVPGRGLGSTQVDSSSDEELLGPPEQWTGRGPQEW